MANFKEIYESNTNTSNTEVKIKKISDADWKELWGTIIGDSSKQKTVLAKILKKYGVTEQELDNSRRMNQGAPAGMSN